MRFQTPHAARAELLTDPGSELVNRLEHRPRPTVCTVGDHRVERVYNVDDPREDGNLLAGESPWVPGPVEMLMVVAHRGDGRGVQPKPLEQVCALVGVGAHDLPLLLVERFWLQQDAIGHRELADIVESCRVAERAKLTLVEPEDPSYLGGELLDTPGMTCRVAVTRVDGSGHPFELG